MTRVDLLSGALPATSPEAVNPASAAAASTAPVGLATTAAVPSGPAAVIGAAFERLRDLSRAHPDVEPSQWIREAVATTLEAQWPTLGTLARGRLADQITQALLADPATRQRLARLMGEPA
jgi:hypothetical protein